MWFFQNWHWAIFCQHLVVGRGQSVILDNLEDARRADAHPLRTKRWLKQMQFHLNQSRPSLE
jgi:hypothetical protein